MKNRTGFQGMVRIQLISADPSGLMVHIVSRNIILEDIVFRDPVTIECSVRRTDYKTVRDMVHKRSETIRVLHRSGWYWTGKRLIDRPVLIVAFLLLLMITAYLPTRILFVNVEGNQVLSAQLIMEKAQACGITFGASRSHVRSEKAKNALLEAIPQLQWAGINTSGCTATITVRERTDSKKTEEESQQVGNIIAAMDGLIVDCTVEKGSLICKPGQAVKTGQILVSGYCDNGLSILATRPEAEIYALTSRELQLVSLTNRYRRGDLIKTEVKYSVQIGKNLINFFNNSGISDTTCVKIYDKQELTLPGGHALPVTLIRETRQYYDLHTEQATDAESFEWVRDDVRSYLQKQMIAGRILSEDYSGQLAEDVYCLTAEYTCVEMIGQYKQEEIIQ